MTYLAIMTMQDVTTPPTFIPHGGPITHSSIGSKPDSPVHHLFPRLFLALGFVCKSWAIFLVIYSSIRRNLFPLLWTPFTLCFRHRTIVHPLEPSYGTFLPWSQGLSWISTREVPLCHVHWDSPQVPILCWASSFPSLSPLTLPPKYRDEISCNGGELWRPDN